MGWSAATASNNTWSANAWSAATASNDTWSAATASTNNTWSAATASTNTWSAATDLGVFRCIWGMEIQVWVSGFWSAATALLIL